MGKKEYMQANKDWLAEKAKEEGVQALPKGSTTRYWLRVRTTASIPRRGASSLRTTRDGPSTGRSLTAAAEGLLPLSA